MDNFKDRLRLALEFRQMTAAELSRKSGIDKGSISNYLKGKFIPKQSNIGEMARALSVSPSWLLGFDVAMDGTAPKTIDVEKLSEINRAKLEAYYQALLDSQGENNGNTQME